MKKNDAILRKKSSGWPKIRIILISGVQVRWKIICKLFNSNLVFTRTPISTPKKFKFIHFYLTYHIKVTTFLILMRINVMNNDWRSLDIKKNWRGPQTKKNGKSIDLNQLINSNSAPNLVPRCINFQRYVASHDYLLINFFFDRTTMGMNMFLTTRSTLWLLT